MQQLRYFIAVLDHGGFTRAAAHLGRTQQAVSKALGLLEDELGARLLDREVRDGSLVALDAPQFVWQRPLELACRLDPAADPALLAVVRALHDASEPARRPPP
jgi:hypothetical protein